MRRDTSGSRAPVPGALQSRLNVATLYLVATPIGNLEDVTLRAVRVLRDADLVLAEDTRHSRTLLERHDISQKPISLHAHNEARRVERVLEVLDGGGDVALVSDAGTPLVSDPGARLVRRAIDEGHAVTAVPGPSAVLAALPENDFNETVERYMDDVKRLNVQN